MNILLITRADAEVAKKEMDGQLLNGGIIHVHWADMHTQRHTVYVNFAQAKVCVSDIFIIIILILKRTVAHHTRTYRLN